MFLLCYMIEFSSNVQWIQIFLTYILQSCALVNIIYLFISIALEEADSVIHFIEE